VSEPTTSFFDIGVVRVTTTDDFDAAGRRGDRALALGQTIGVGEQVGTYQRALQGSVHEQPAWTCVISLRQTRTPQGLDASYTETSADYSAVAQREQRGVRAILRRCVPGRDHRLHGSVEL
jgi:hypothetical protein